jgi:site-specific DNA-methyltransferase (adenine-specific)
MPRPSSAFAADPGPGSRLVPAQVELGLPAAAPTLPLEADWADQPRLWGPPLHPTCSYLASFPAALAHAFIARYTRPGDVVLDPFAGRGTTPYQALTEGRLGVGNDLNPLAHVLTAAKVEPPSAAEALTRLTALRLAHGTAAGAWGALGMAAIARPGEGGVRVPTAGSGHGPDGGTETVPTEVAVAFHPTTLGAILSIRAALRLDDPVDRFLAAALAGILHGKTAGYCSTVMPNTFSMAPRYVERFVERNGFVAPARDPFALLEAKLARLLREPLPRRPGIALQGDARTAGVRATAALRARGLPDRARLVLTSPPYLRVVRYGYYNWLRTWLLGFDSRGIDAALDQGHGREAYIAFLREVLAGLRPVLAADAVVVLVIGDVERDRGRPSEVGHDLAGSVWADAAAPEAYRLAGVVSDPVAPARKMTRLWGAEAGRATSLDRILVLGASEAGRRRALGGASMPVDWAWPPRGPRAI